MAKGADEMNERENGEQDQVPSSDLFPREPEEISGISP
jgi:hypothetical protein